MINDIRENKKVSKNPEDNEPPEHSIPLRVVVFLMALICVAASCFFVHTHIIMTLIYVFLIIAGSYLSYVYREEEPKWLRYTWIVGIFAVGANALREFTGPLRDDFDFVSPFVHFLAGVFVFVTFSMRRRSDLNVSSGLGLILLCMIAPVAKGIDYGICVASYLTLGTLMMYFDCVSRTTTSWVSKPMMQAPEVALYRSKPRRMPKGNTILLVAGIPVAAMLLFMFLPRADELLDKMWAATKSFDLFSPTVPAASSDAKRERTNRDWFEQHTSFMKKLDEDRKKQEKAAQDEAIKEKKKPKKDKKKVDAKQPKPSTPSLNPVLEKAEEAGKKAQEEEERKAQAKKLEAEKKQEEKKQEEKKQQEKKDQAKSKDPKKEPEKDKAKTVDSKKQEAENNKKQDKKDKEKTPKKEPGAEEKKDKSESKSDQKDKSKGESKSDSKAKDQEQKPEGKDKNKPSDASAPGDDKNSQKKNSAKGKKGGGGKGGKNGGSGAGGKGGTTGGGGKNSATGGKKKGNSLSSDKIQLGSDEELDLTKPAAVSDSIILLVKSRRIVYLRRQAYDKYTGHGWKKSIDAKNRNEANTVRVADGIVQKKFVVKAADLPAQPNVVPQYAGQQSYPAAQGGDPNNRQVTKPTVNILASASSQAPVGESITLNAPASTDAKKVDQSAATTTEDSKQSYLGKERYFIFDSNERPKFLVGMADAFAPPEKNPSVDVVQEVQVKAKSIGNIVPGAWIPSEVGLKQTRVVVDELGVMRTKAPLIKDDIFKVKSELAMFPLEKMRAAPLRSPYEEEQIRNTFKSYLQLPDTVDDKLFTLAESNANPQNNWYVQAEQIAAFLRKDYLLDPLRPVSPEVQDTVNEFLFTTKVGHSTDFASSFVMLTRCIGIPSRLVSGFSPGQQNPVSGAYEVSLANQHYWAEAFIPEYGWVPFDATPEGFLPAQKRENRYTFDEVKKQLGADKEEDADKLKHLLDYLVYALAALVTLAVAAFVGRALYKAIKRYIANRTGRGPEWGLYRKACKRLKKRLKVKREPHETSEQFVNRVRSTVAEQQAQGKNVSDGIPVALDAFMKSYNLVYFGRREDELENLKYHADQLNKQIGTDTKTEAMAAASGAASSQAEGAVRPNRRR
jgi:Transglutaminase-like enzymes, putative cysteine proteases